MQLLRGHPDLSDGAGVRGFPGAATSWFLAGSPDPIADLRSTPAGYASLDTSAQRACDQSLAHRDLDQWVGRTRTGTAAERPCSGELVATFDWELVVEHQR